MLSPPVIILGAPRSGTNMLRDILSKIDNIVTWDCDEINPIWKYNNYSKSDELKPSDLSPGINKFISNEFNKVGNYGNIVMEKTCANSLRPDFVKSIIPEARFIYIYRNGFDCAISAKKKSKRKFDFKYQFKKIKYAPIRSYPFLAYEKLFTRNWGPYYKGMKNDYRSLNRLQIVSKQWMKCNESCIDFVSRTSQNIYQLNYDDFVNNPKEQFERILDYLELNTNLSKKINFGNIYKSSIGRGKVNLSSHELNEISQYISDINHKLKIHER